MTASEIAETFFDPTSGDFERLRDMIIEAQEKDSDATRTKAQGLVEQWIREESKPVYSNTEYTQKYTIAACRRELQAAFGLGSLGSAPPSDSGAHSV